MVGKEAIRHKWSDPEVRDQQVLHSTLELNTMQTVDMYQLRGLLPRAEDEMEDRANRAIMDKLYGEIKRELWGILHEHSSFLGFGGERVLRQSGIEAIQDLVERIP